MKTRNIILIGTKVRVAKLMRDKYSFGCPPAMMASLRASNFKGTVGAIRHCIILTKSSTKYGLQEGNLGILEEKN